MLDLSSLKAPTKPSGCPKRRRRTLASGPYFRPAVFSFTASRRVQHSWQTMPSFRQVDPGLAPHGRCHECEPCRPRRSKSICLKLFAVAAGYSVVHAHPVWFERYCTREERRQREGEESTLCEPYHHLHRSGCSDCIFFLVVCVVARLESAALACCQGFAVRAATISGQAGSLG